MIELSVVLISRNQEWNIARLIESVLSAVGSQDSTEVILVDSASSDQTTEIAARYPITVYKLNEDQHLSAAAGRYIGYKHTTGDLVLFLDGDMELCPGWLEQAIEVINSQSEVAVVCGRVIDRPIEFELTSSTQSTHTFPVTSQITNVLHGGGASLYRRSVLENVGTFNPWLYSDEEPELCLRIRHAGYKIIRLPQPIAFHYTVTWDALSTFLAKRKGNIWLGYGQNIRYFLGSPYLFPYLKERGWAIPPAAFLCAGFLAGLISVLTNQWLWILLWVASLVLIILGIAIRKQSLERALLILFRKLLILDGTIRGFFHQPNAPGAYPGKFAIVKQMK